MISLDVLILSGTGEGRALAAALESEGGIEFESSLAGRTRTPTPPPGPHRIGGFGGIEGLRRYLVERSVRALVDATHPFARQITANAVVACEVAGVPRLRLSRPSWTERPGDHWIRVNTMEEAAARTRMSHSTTPFLTVGRLELPAFHEVRGAVVRTIDRPEPMPPDPKALILDRGPFTLEGEIALMRDHGVDLLVTKESGGGATASKLDAARALGIPVLLVARPPDPPGPIARNVGEALDWIRRTLGGQSAG